MRRLPIEERLPRAFHTLRTWSEELDKICETSHFGSDSGIPRGSCEQIAEAILDIGEAGGDSAAVGQLVSECTHFIEYGSKRKKPHYEGIPCGMLRRTVREALRVFAPLDLTPPKPK